MSGLARLECFQDLVELLLEVVQTGFDSKQLSIIAGRRIAHYGGSVFGCIGILCYSIEIGRRARPLSSGVLGMLGVGFHGGSALKLGLRGTTKRSPGRSW